MKPVFQTKYGNPEGNCFAACVASILECSIDELPNLYELEQSGKNWLIGLNEAIKPKGYGVAYIEAKNEAVDMFLPEGAYFIASGDASGSCQHSCVYQNIEGDAVMIHDPNPGAKVGLKKINTIQIIIKL